MICSLFPRLKDLNFYLFIKEMLQMLQYRFYIFALGGVLHNLMKKIVERVLVRVTQDVLLGVKSNVVQKDEWLY